MDIKLLEKFLAENNEPGFRLKQCLEAYVSGNFSSWDEVMVLPEKLREKLKNKISFWNFSASEVRESKDGSFKAMMTLNDDEKIETVILPAEKNNYTVCLSSQVGCAMGCKFCATGSMGFKRNLTVSEFIDQFFFWNNFLSKNKPDAKLAGGVVMGMGEPMLNYENIAEGFSFIIKNTKMSAGRFAISTVGISNGINKMKDDERLSGVNLALSLHASDQNIREKIMPKGAGMIHIEELIKVCLSFAKKRKQKVFIEYLALDNINDTEKDAKKLAELLRYPKYFHVNLIRYNETFRNFKSADEKTIEKFRNVLRRKGFDVTRRRSHGSDIAGACGQLVINELK